VSLHSGALAGSAADGRSWQVQRCTPVRPVATPIPQARAKFAWLNDPQLGVHSDHFAWIKAPAAVAAALLHALADEVHNDRVSQKD
jgi:hypothetical protein